MFCKVTVRDGKLRIREYEDSPFSFPDLEPWNELKADWAIFDCMITCGDDNK